MIATGASLSTFDGIANAREDLYNKLMAGEIPEARAGVGDRMLTNQQKLKELPLKAANFFTRLKGHLNEEQQRWLGDRVLGNFGYEPKGLKSGK